MWKFSVKSLDSIKDICYDTKDIERYIVITKKEGDAKMVTSRELVLQTMEFRNPQRIPRNIWALPWAFDHYPEEMKRLYEEYPDDFATAPGFLRQPPETKGDPYEIGEYVDEWGCVFENRQKGVIGEVKRPVVEDWADLSRVHFPKGWLTLDRDKINRFCQDTTRFVQAGFCPRPFEQLQFLRGTENLMMDLMDPEPEMLSFIQQMHEFYCEGLSLWAKTDVDALFFMDDWGTQKALLIPPRVWRAIFKPLYRDYIRIAHEAGKKVMMHSDGNTIEILPDLIELGLDAINTQIFCIGVENLAPFAGKITFWGELDRQRLLCFAEPEEVEEAVQQVYRTLWKNGGCIAQMECSAGMRPENIFRAYETWAKVK